MPTINPRVNVTLSPSLDALVSQFAAHQRRSKSQVLRELLEAAEPALQRAVALMDAAARAGPEVMAGLAGGMLRAQERIEDVLAGGLARIEERTQREAGPAASPEAQAGGRGVKNERRGRRAEAQGGGYPPSSNRGVRSVDQGPGKARKTARRGK